MRRDYQLDDKEPMESNFKLPKEAEHLFQVVDVNPVQEPSGENPDIQTVKLEIVGGDDNGLSILNRVKLNPEDKAFYYTRLFLKAIGEAYKGQFDVETDRWIGRQFYATVKHSPSKDGTKTYANIGEYNFSKVVEQPVKSINLGGISDPKDIAWND